MFSLNYPDTGGPDLLLVLVHTKIIQPLDV